MTAMAHAPVRLGRFVMVMCPPQIYVTCGVLWSAAVEGSAVALSGYAWRPSVATALRAASVVLTLVFLRMVDEQKDLDHDRVHHPDRPLVTGAITAGELRAAMTLIVLVILALNVSLGPLPALLAVLPAGYGLLLMLVERRSVTIREGLVGNLFAALPGQLLISGYVYLSVTATTTVRAGWRGVPLVLIFVGVFLHLEFARKTSWRPQPGARAYSQVMGPVGSAAVTLALAVAAAGLAAAVFGLSTSTGLPAVLLVLVAAVGGWRFLRSRQGDWPLLPPTLFVLGSLLSLIVRAAMPP